MKHIILVIACCGLGWGTASAQLPKALRAALPAVSAPAARLGAEKCIAFELGNYRVQLPPAVMSAHGIDLWTTHLSSQLDPALYARSSVKNNAHILKSVRRFVRDYERFHIKAADIAGRIESCVLRGEIPYQHYLPQQLQTLYIGEVHEIAGLSDEVADLIRALPSLYPKRSIYLATEFLPAEEQLPAPFSRPITRREELDRLLDGDGRMSSRVLYAAVETGIPVIGLEREQSLLRRIAREIPQTPTWENYEDFAVSFEGMRVRNKMWAQSLRALRNADPDALIVVYAGFGHVGYNKDFNLPSMLGGKSFVVLFTTPEFLSLNNTLFRYFREEAHVRKAFHSSLDAKLVERWTKASPDKKIMGTDLTVILHPQK